MVANFLGAVPTERLHGVCIDIVGSRKDVVHHSNLHTQFENNAADSVLGQLRSWRRSPIPGAGVRTRLLSCMLITVNIVYDGIADEFASGIRTAFLHCGIALVQ